MSTGETCTWCLWVEGLHPKIEWGLLCRALTWSPLGEQPTEVSWAVSPGGEAFLHPDLWKCPSRTTWLQLCCLCHHLIWFCAGAERSLRHQCTSLPVVQGILLQETQGVLGIGR